jgi:hypothetical protein
MSEEVRAPTALRWHYSEDLCIRFCASTFSCFSRHVETFLRDTDIQERQHNVEDYRAILSAIPKIFEVLIYKTIYDDLKNLISMNQHGFMKNRLTVTNLLEYAFFVLNSIEEGWQVDSVYTDFSKAFDQVRHHLLLMEMSVGI